MQKQATFPKVKNSFTFPKVKNSFVGRYGFRENYTAHGMHYSCPECDCDDVWVELTVYNTRQRLNVATCGRCGHQGAHGERFEKRLTFKLPLRRAGS